MKFVFVMVCVAVEIVAGIKCYVGIISTQMVLQDCGAGIEQCLSYPSTGVKSCATSSSCNSPSAECCSSDGCNGDNTDNTDNTGIKCYVGIRSQAILQDCPSGIQQCYTQSGALMGCVQGSTCSSPSTECCSSDGCNDNTDNTDNTGIKCYVGISPQTLLQDCGAGIDQCLSLPGGVKSCGVAGMNSCISPYECCSSDGCNVDSPDLNKCFSVDPSDCAAIEEMGHVNATQSNADLVQQLNSICGSDCFRRIRDEFPKAMPCLQDLPGASDVFLGIFTSMEDVVGNFCLKNDVTGEYCLSAMSTMEDDDSFNQNVTLTSEEVASSCFKLQQYGCCTATILELIDDVQSTPSSIPVQSTPSSIKEFVSHCGWTSLPEPCLKVGETKKIVEISINSNINWDDWNELSEVEQQVALYGASKDLASKLNLNPEDLIAKEFTKNANGELDLNFLAFPTDSNPNLQQTIQEVLSGDTQVAWTNLIDALPDTTEIETTNPDVVETEIANEDTSSCQRIVPGLLFFSFVILWRLF